MRFSLPIKLMASYLLVVAVVVGPSVWLLRGRLVSAFVVAEATDHRGRVAEVRDRLASLPESEHDRAIRDWSALLGLRITVVRADGTVAADSDVEPSGLSRLENHADRFEVREALAGRFGYDARHSATLSRDLVYAALPLPAQGTPRAAVRIAFSASPIRDAVGSALLGQRVAAGIGVSAAILLSYITALFVSSPLRRMRDAARAFAQARWVEVKPTRTGDELEELSVALDDLGRKLREKLVDIGAQESPLMQAVRALPQPALVLDETLAPLEVNGAYRRWAGLNAANEVERLAQLGGVSTLRAARRDGERTGLATEASLAPPGSGEPPSRALLVPLPRPGAPARWLLLVEPDRAAGETSRAESVHRFLRGAEAILDRLWEEKEALRPQLARMRARLDEAAAAAGPPEAVSVEPVPAQALVRRAVAEAEVLVGGEAHVDLDIEQLTCAVAESAGLAARAVRTFIAGALRAAPPDRRVMLTAETGPSEVRLLLEGAAPADIDVPRQLARALGADAGRDPAREREAAWLALPRA